MSIQGKICRKYPGRPKNTRQKGINMAAWGSILGRMPGVNWPEIREKYARVWVVAWRRSSSIAIRGPRGRAKPASDRRGRGRVGSCLAARRALDGRKRLASVAASPEADFVSPRRLWSLYSRRLRKFTPVCRQVWPARARSAVRLAWRSPAGRPGAEPLRALFPRRCSPC